MGDLLVGAVGDLLGSVDGTFVVFSADIPVGGSVVGFAVVGTVVG